MNAWVLVGAMGTLALINATSASAQMPLSRADAIRMALSNSPRATVAVSDTAAAAARLRVAREYPNPTISVGYSKSTPRAHVSLDVPLDLPNVRGARVRSATAARQSAQYTFEADRIALVLDVDTLYVKVQVALARRDASAVAAQEAAQLVRIADTRRAAGDASDLDVELARVSANQAASSATGDSADARDALLDWQAAMGVASDSIRFYPSDSTLPPMMETNLGAPLSDPRVAAAIATERAARETVSLQRASRFGVPSVQFGVEAKDPTEPGVLPTLGVAIPIPLFNRAGGEVAAARADVDRARAERQVVTMQATAEWTRAVHQRASALARVALDSQTVASAHRVLMLSRTAYQEGEMTITEVLQAQHSYRDVLLQYQSDRLTWFINDAIIRAWTGQLVEQP